MKMKIVLFLGIFSLLWDLSVQKLKSYCDITPKHVACKNYRLGNACINAKEWFPGLYDKHGILHWHNQVRERVASGQENNAKDGTLPPAANMRKLRWDHELATIAQAQTNECVFQGSCQECKYVMDDRFTFVGQNLALFGTTGDIEEVDFVSSIDKWYSKNIHNFPTSLVWRYVSSADINKYGDYSQVIWAETKAVGCGGILYEDDKYKYEMVTCNYGEAGNIIDRPVYKIGEPCSACPEGTTCQGALCA